MGTIMKDNWTESQVTGLPSGEHDFFERKSGALLSSADFRKDIGKVLSALANSGGGHLLLGVSDDGSLDGVEPMKRGRTSTRDWLEQVVPNLVSFPLQQFRVHQVEPSAPSSIPNGRVVIVVDVGDSTLAPHQAAESKIYYFRQGGRSEPAPHFYLETLRNRLINPLLTVEMTRFRVVAARRLDDDIFVEAMLTFTIKNVGAIAAYKWAVVIDSHEGHHPSRANDYLFSRKDFPWRASGRSSSIPLDTTILPSLSITEDRDFGFYLRPQAFALRPTTVRPSLLASELEVVLPDTFEIFYRIVSETSPGERVSTKPATLLERPGVATEILGLLNKG